MGIMDEKPESFVEYGYVLCGLYKADKMDKWIDKLIEDYEKRLFNLTAEVKKLRLSTQSMIKEEA